MNGYDAMGNPTGGDDIPQIDPQAPGVSPTQLDYYRQKVVEFQTLLLQLDLAATQANRLAWEDISPDQSLADDMNGYLAEYDLKKGSFRAAAEALNFAISGVNMIGGGFPTVSIPKNLGIVPMVAAAAGVAAALGVVSGLIIWGRDWIAGVNERAKQKLQLDAIEDPAKRAAAAQVLMNLDAAQKASESSPLSTIAGMVKWVLLAGVVYFLVTRA